MSHVPMEALSQKLAEAKAIIALGARYAHYKHPDQAYTIVDVAILEATDEPAVIYRAEYGDRVTFIRPFASFVETVETEAGNVARFSPAQ